MKIRTPLLAGVAVFSLVAAACAGVFSRGSPPSSYQPKPGDLLYYTNASISYNSTAKHPHIVVIDAKAKRIVADAEISSVNSSPHGLGASPDGSHLYLPAGIGSPIPALGSPQGGVKFGNGVTVIDARTLKPTQAISTLDAPHHIQVLNDRLVMSDAWGVKQVLFVLDPSQDNAMTHQIAADAFGGRPYIGFPAPDGQSIFMTVRPPQGSPSKDAWISRVNLSDWSVKKVANVGPGAVWTAFSRDGKFAYVTVPEDDRAVKVDLAQGKIVGEAPTGRGPYGTTLSPDETRLFVVSKGEGGRGQRGGTFVVIDAESMRLLEERPSCKAFVCQADHVVISPDGKEFWISNNMGYITVFDLKTLAMKAEITMPLRADPHGGVFVQYDRNGKGHVVMDLGGPHGGASPYAYDNEHGIPSLTQALAKGWAGASASSPLALEPGASGSTSTTARATAAPKAVNVDLTMEDFYFAPRDLTVPAGTPVTFRIVNKGQAVHNFTSTALGIKQRDVNANGSAQVNWNGTDKPGTYKYVCTFHPGMEGSITVK